MTTTLEYPELMKPVLGKMGGSTYCYSHPEREEKLMLNSITCETQQTGFTICASVSGDNKPIITKKLFFSEVDGDRVKIVCEVDFSGYPRNLIKMTRELDKACLTGADIEDVWTKI
ncbi:hypothetical protein [Shimazuella kribbensis]|uniref:hypothetical protein n=1 Tax=Shimazuella kribbensis TaxID=139808 RepID=UPI00048BCB44|nr:hypothetical protein [Shimazuella kribbensis]